MAQPKVRGSKSAQTTTLTALTPSLPTGTEIGDLVFILAEAYAKTGTIPTITVPEGWTTLGGEQVEEAEGNKRRWILAYKKLTSLTMPEWKVSSVPGNSFNLYALAYEKGTFSSSTPIGSNSAWVKGAAAAENTAPSSVATVNESSAVCFTCSPSGPIKEFTAGWVARAATQTGPGNESFTKEASLSNGESTGEPKYKKAGTVAGWAMMVTVAPTGSFVTLPTITQSQVPTVLKELGRKLSATVSQVIKLARGDFRTLSIVQGITATVAGSIHHNGEIVVGQIVTVNKQITRAPFELSQGQAVSQKRELSRTLSASQPQNVPPPLAAKPAKPLEVTQPQILGVGSEVEHVKKVTQQTKVNPPGHSFTRALSVTQSVSVSFRRMASVLLPLIKQPQKAQGGRTHLVTLVTSQTQSASLISRTFRLLGLRAFAHVEKPPVYPLDIEIL